jgi:hypothetical protein
MDEPGSSDLERLKPAMLVKEKAAQMARLFL